MDNNLFSLTVQLLGGLAAVCSDTSPVQKQITLKIYTVKLFYRIVAFLANSDKHPPPPMISASYWDFSVKWLRAPNAAADFWARRVHIFPIEKVTPAFACACEDNTQAFASELREVLQLFSWKTGLVNL